MTVPKLRTVNRNGSRYYIHPETRERAIGVTSVVGMLPKPFLQYWAAKVVAQHAVDNLGPLVGLVLKDPKGAVDWLKGAPRRDTGDAADRGDAIHNLVEDIARGKSVGRVHPDYRPYVDGFRHLCDTLQPEFLHLESTVWNADLGISGTFDWLARFDAGQWDPALRGESVLVIGDNKTTRSGVHAEVALQLYAYASAPVLFLPTADGNWEEAPMPGPIVGGMVFHLRPEASKAVPVSIYAGVPHPFLKDDAGEPLTITPADIFRSLVMVHHWDRELSDIMLRPPVSLYEVETT